MTIQSGPHAMESMQLEERRYPPPPEFARNANARPDIYTKELEDFWREEASKRVSWFKPFDTVLEWKLPYAKWFLGGSLNAVSTSSNRPSRPGKGPKVAYTRKGDPWDSNCRTTL